MCSALGLWPECRLQKCKAELLKQVEQEGHTIALCSKLGAVCGSQGDCHRQVNQPQQAKACYEESVHHLRACQSQDAEVGGGLLCVTLILSMGSCYLPAVPALS